MGWLRRAREEAVEPIEVWGGKEPLYLDIDTILQPLPWQAAQRAAAIRDRHAAARVRARRARARWRGKV